jgi:hypothetical protein
MEPFCAVDWGRHQMNCKRLVVVVAAAALLASSPAVGHSINDGLLSPADYSYLAAQGIERNSPILQKMSPKEQWRLHQTINDQNTAGDQEARKQAVLRVLGEFEANQQWEQSNPGRLWDQKDESPRG